MTHLTTLTLATALVLTPVLATAQAQLSIGSDRFTPGETVAPLQRGAQNLSAAAGAAGDDDECQDYFIIYEFDEDGDPDPHTIEVGCAD